MKTKLDKKLGTIHEQDRDYIFIGLAFIVTGLMIYGITIATDSHIFPLTKLVVGAFLIAGIAYFLYGMMGLFVRANFSGVKP